MSSRQNETETLCHLQNLSRFVNLASYVKFYYASIEMCFLDREFAFPKFSHFTLFSLAQKVGPARIFILLGQEKRTKNAKIGIRAFAQGDPCQSSYGDQRNVYNSSQ